MPFRPSEPEMLFLQRYISAVRNGDQASSKQLRDFFRSGYPDLITSISTECYDYLKTATAADLQLDLRSFQSAFDNLPATLGNPTLDEPLELCRAYLEKAIKELEWGISTKGGATTAAQQQVAQIKAQVQMSLEAIRLLEEQCEEDVKKYPQHEKEIRRRYRKAIDALMEADNA